MTQADWTKSYWMEVEPHTGQLGKPKEGGVLIIGSGLSGASTAYWLTEAGYPNVTIADYELPKAATFRNCGHILYGTVESMKALVALHGRSVARELWNYSIEICHEVRETIARLGMDADYAQSGYLVIAIDENENKEVLESIELLNSMGFESSYRTAAELSELGFKNTFGARHEKGSAQAHPVKFRNGLIGYCQRQGVDYFSGVQVNAVEERGEDIVVSTNHGDLRYDAVVVAANAYNPLLSSFFRERRLIDPFKGQIITSKPLAARLPVTYPHSFDHGYEYALVTPDNRLMIGGWRNHVPGMETGTYDVMPNAMVEQGLKDFVSNHYRIQEPITWEYSWSGIMAASRTGFPFIGPTTSQRIFTCSGYTGHGFSWAHGSAKLLVDIMVGNQVNPVARLFNPKTN